LGQVISAESVIVQLWIEVMEAKMTNTPEFDVEAAHIYFSATCFNKAWELLDKADRTAEEDEQMIRLGQSSAWHWTQRDDCTDQNMSIAYWQISRIYSILGQAHNAKRYAELCLGVSQGDDMQPFTLGYAYEALARAEMAAGNKKKADEYLQEAHKLLAVLTDEHEKKFLGDDLATIT
jgi:tetratricopeptide (TPR) repeat protein